MKKALLSLFFVLFAIVAFGQSTGIQGLVLSPNGEPVSNAVVSLVGTNTMNNTDSQGKFVIEGISAGTYQIGVYALGFENYFKTDIKVEAGSLTNVEITLTVLTSIDNNDGVAIVNEDDLNETGSDNISSVLHGSKDAFLDATSYSLGPLRFSVRGYDNEYSETTINGAPMANMETGRVYWSNWGGLNNVTNYKTVAFGLDAADASFGNVGGSTDIQMIPSSFRKGLKLTYSATNRSYRNRAMVTYSTGLMDNNWAFTLSGSRRWANEGYVPGTFYDSWSYYLGAEKHLDKHTFILNVFGSPTKRGKQGGSTQEAYDIVGSNFYNPYWGYQNGKVRNSRVAILHQPTAILNHSWKINSTTKLNTVLAGRAGRNGSTALNWYNTADPRPDYYRYLPSYITSPEDSLLQIQNFEESGLSQIQWDDMYFANMNNEETVENADGIDGNTVTGNRALYIIEERRYDQIYGTFSSNLVKDFSDKVKLTAGVQYNYFVGKNFKVIYDLLGADYWLDIDKYAERDFGGTGSDSIQTDINNPNGIAKVGDIFGYNYESHINTAKTWAQTTIDLNKVNINIAAYASYTTMWRNGKMNNGLFPNELSYGNSEKLKFLDYGAKTGVIYKINGRNFVQGHAAYMTQAPTFRNTYISPRTRNTTIENPVSEKIMSADIGYTLKAPRIKATFNAFYTQFQDQSKIMSFYHDGYANFVNYAMTGIDKTHQGIEMAIDGNITSAFSAYAVASLGYYRYTSRPLVSITVDNSAEVLTADKVVYIQNFLVDGTPQTAGSVGLRYKTNSYWFFNINANYVADRYLSFNPERRTAEAVEGILPDSEQWEAIVDQVVFDPAYTIDASIGKSFRFQHKYYLNLNFSVNNILNNQNIITGGYEQLRYDQEDQDPYKFPAKLYYLYGRQFYLNISFSF